MGFLVQVYISKCSVFRKFTEFSVLLLEETTVDGSETTIPPNAGILYLTICIVVLGVDVHIK